MRPKDCWEVSNCWRSFVWRSHQQLHLWSSLQSDWAWVSWSTVRQMSAVLQGSVQCSMRSSRRAFAFDLYIHQAQRRILHLDQTAWNLRWRCFERSLLGEFQSLCYKRLAFLYWEQIQKLHSPVLCLSPAWYTQRSRKKVVWWHQRLFERKLNSERIRVSRLIRHSCQHWFSSQRKTIKKFIVEQMTLQLVWAILEHRQLFSRLTLWTSHLRDMHAPSK